MELKGSFENFNLPLAFLIMFAFAFVDALYAYYTLAVVKLKPERAATSGIIIHLIAAFGVLSYVNNLLYLIPLVAGSWIGTYLMVKKEKDNKFLFFKKP